MEIIRFFGKKPGLFILAAVMALLFVLVFFVVRKSSKRNLTGRILFPVFFIGASLCFLAVSFTLPVKGDEVGPAVVPILWISGIILFSVVILARIFLGLEEEDPKWGRIGIVAGYLAFTIFYLYLMIYIGYYLATLVYLCAGIYVLSYKNWKVIAGLSAGWILFSYVAFYRLLYVPLPKGILIERIFG